MALKSDMTLQNWIGLSIRKWFQKGRLSLADQHLEDMFYIGWAAKDKPADFRVMPLHKAVYPEGHKPGD